MAWYRLAFRPSVLEDLLPLDRPMAQRLIDKTKWLASNAGHLRHEPVAPELPGLCKYAVETWRIYYALDHDGSYLDVHGIVERRTP